jgi:hypothetical protein
MPTLAAPMPRGGGFGFDAEGKGSRLPWALLGVIGVVGILREDLPVLYLYNPRAAFAHTARLNGFVPYPDGIIRLEGVTLAAR